MVYRWWNKVELRLIRLATRGDASEARMPGGLTACCRMDLERRFCNRTPNGNWTSPATAGESEARDSAAKYGVLVRRATCFTVPCGEYLRPVCAVSRQGRRSSAGMQDCSRWRGSHCAGRPARPIAVPITGMDCSSPIPASSALIRVRALLMCTPRPQCGQSDALPGLAPSVDRTAE